MERLLFRKVEMWLVGLIAILAVVAMIAFGNVVVHVMKGGRKAGVLGDIAFSVSNLPAFFQSFDKARPFRAWEDRHPGQSGFSFSYAAGERPDAGYLLLNRFDGDDLRPMVELYDLNTRKLVHRWSPDTDAIFADAAFSSNLIDLGRDRNLSRMLLRHAYVNEDGSMVVGGHATPLFKVDACDRLVWVNPENAFHHSLERDADGNFWSPVHIEPSALPGADQKIVQDDGIAKIAPDGTVIATTSVAGLLLDQGLRHLVYGADKFNADPIHLNDIQPALTDGRFWKKGDLFLSLRNLSMIALYRPSTGKILWSKQGPWLHQHDVDILDDHRISVFNNNAAALAAGMRSLGPVEVNVYDFETDSVTSPWKDQLAALKVETRTEGLHTVLADGGLFIEEQNYGNVFRMTADGKIIWQYVNRARSGSVFTLGWSRLLTPEEGGRIARSLAATTCG